MGETGGEIGRGREAEGDGLAVGPHDHDGDFPFGKSGKGGKGEGGGGLDDDLFDIVEGNAAEYGRGADGAGGGGVCWLFGEFYLEVLAGEMSAGAGCSEGEGGHGVGRFYGGAERLSLSEHNLTGGGGIAETADLAGGPLGNSSATPREGVDLFYAYAERVAPGGCWLGMAGRCRRSGNRGPLGRSARGRWREEPGLRGDWRKAAILFQ